jgi:pimeloyl-ACP methyl ester carboxylesterase
MGSLWGATSPVTQHSPTIYADLGLAAGGSIPIDPDAEERAVYLAEGDAELDGLRLERRVLYVLRPGIRATLRSQDGARVMLCGGAGAGRPAPCLVELRLLPPRPHQPGQGRLAQPALPGRAGRRGGADPASRGGQDGQLPLGPSRPGRTETLVNELQTTRIGLKTGVSLKVALGGTEGAEPIIFLHGFPESHRTWRHQLHNLERDFYVVAPDQRGFGASDKPEGVEAYRTDRIVADLLALADALRLPRFTLVGHDWGGAVAWSAAFKHPDRIARLVIINSPHPLVFQRSVIDDEAQRAASQYIRAFRVPGFEKSIEAMGYETFFEKSFTPHVDLRLIAERERDAYLHDWSQPAPWRRC